MGSGFHLYLSMIFSDARQIGAKNGMNGEQAFTRLTGAAVRAATAGGWRAPVPAGGDARRNVCEPPMNEIHALDAPVVGQLDCTRSIGERHWPSSLDDRFRQGDRAQKSRVVDNKNI